MLELLNLTRGNIIATKTNDLLGLNDYEKIHPFIHNILENGQKVRWYFEMELISFSGVYGFWEDGVLEVNYRNTHFRHSDDFEKIAIVGHPGCEKLMIDIMKPFSKARLQYFELRDKHLAEEWITDRL